MSYQLGSMPVIRQKVHINKHNDYERLRDEYERIKAFNVNGVELKMRQVRLGRLLKEIDDLRANQMRRNYYMKQRLANSMIRKKYDHDSDEYDMIYSDIDSLISKKERNYQDQYQQQNTSKYNNGVPYGRSTRKRPRNIDTSIYTYSSPVSNTNDSKNVTPRFKITYNKVRQLHNDDQLSKARVLRRTNYGNKISSWNMQRMLVNHLRKNVQADIKHTISESESLAKKLKEKLLSDSKNVKAKQFSTNTVNEAIVAQKAQGNTYGVKKKTASIDRSTKQRDDAITSCESNITQIPVQCSHILTVSTYDNQKPNNDRFEQLQKQKLKLNKCFQTLREAVQNRSHRDDCNDILEKLDECHQQLEYQLRNISNSMNLSKSGLIFSECIKLGTSDCDDDDEDDAVGDNEVVLSKKQLYNCLPTEFTDATSEKSCTCIGDEVTLVGSSPIHTDTSYEDATSNTLHSSPKICDIVSKPPPIPPPLPTHLQKGSTPRPLFAKVTSQRLQKQQKKDRYDEFVRKFGGISHGIVKNEVNDYSVQKLKGIFEHRE